MRWLLAVEFTSVVAFVGAAAWSVAAVPAPIPTIDAAALAAGATEETWTGVFVEQQHVGYAVARSAPTADGGTVYHQESMFRIQAMGNVERVVTAGTAVTNGKGELVSFDFLLSSPVRIIGRGEVKGTVIHLELDQAGDIQSLDIPVNEPPQLSMTLAGVVRGRQLHPGDHLTVSYFDPITLSNAPMDMIVDAPEPLANGEVGWWITTKFGAVETRKLIDENGETLREESPMGFSAVRMTRAEALDVDAGDPPDMVAMVAVPVTGLTDGRTRTRVSLTISGVDPGKVPNEPPLQSVVGNTVTVSIPALTDLPNLPVIGEGDTEATLSLPAKNAEMVAKAKEIVGDAPTRLEAVRRLNTFVHDYVQKVPTIGVPNGLEVLHAARGDCNEHTALFVSLARAAGIPSRIAAGLVHSDRLGDAFYYHAWPEVRLGGPTDWVPVDPTFGEFPADATHLKLVTGDLDRQVEIMGVMGRIHLDLVEAR